MIFWTILISLSLKWNLGILEQHSLEDAQSRGKNMFFLIKSLEIWNSLHGGVYALVTKASQPDPYLDIPDRDIKALNGKIYTMINPAKMISQLSEITDIQKKIIIHITSLKPISPANQPDEWETETLREFEDGKTDRITVLQKGDNKFFRYMAVLRLEESCLKCHAKQGYKNGDIKGGISITFATRSLMILDKDQKINQIILHLSIYILVSFLSLYLFFQIRKQWVTLKNIQNDQELKIQKRTFQLEEVNIKLENELNMRKQMEMQLKELNQTLEQGIKNEIEKRRKKEQMLIQQAKMASMGEMIGAIAHQWRQPLNALGLLVQDIKEAYQLNELNQEYIDKSINDSMEQIEFMSNTIDDFRSFFRRSKEKLSFNIIKSIGFTLSIFSTQLKNNNIKLELVFNETEDIIVNGFYNEFNQVILNILTNAKDAIIEARTQGYLDAAEGLIIITALVEYDRAVLKIGNNGGNIPVDLLDTIFEPYFTTKEEGKGTGIGLYMSKAIIEQNMNGKIFAENIDHGVIFTIYLDIYQEEGAM